MLNSIKWTDRPMVLIPLNKTYSCYEGIPVIIKDGCYIMKSEILIKIPYKSARFKKWKVKFYDRICFSNSISKEVFSNLSCTNVIR